MQASPPLRGQAAVEHLAHLGMGEVQQLLKSCPTLDEQSLVHQSLDVVEALLHQGIAPLRPQRIQQHILIEFPTARTQ